MRASLIRSILYGVGLLGVMLIVVVLGRTLTLDSRQVSPKQTVSLDVSEEAPRRLADAVQYQTVTARDPAAIDTVAYRRFYSHLEDAFPRVHDRLDTTHVNTFSRLYTWQGADSTLAPVVLMAHVDVVPVEADTAWRHPPYASTIEDGYIWGRGTLDDKASAVGILESVSSLLESEGQPDRTIHVALGHDEEVGGRRGGRAIEKRLTSDGRAPALVIDEGGAVTKGALPGLSRPLAVVGVAEKGYLSLTLRATGDGGHSSAPPEETSIEILNEALSRVLNNPLPARVDGLMGRTLDYVAPEMSLPMRSVLANRWLTAPALRRMLGQEPAAQAAIRTVQVPTRLDAGVKDNVIPTEARAVINYRVLPNHSLEQVHDHVRSLTEGFSVAVTRGQASSPVSPSAVEDTTFRLVQRTIREVTSDSVVVAPYLVPGTTDSRHYADVTDHVYRFVPYTLTPDDRSRIHGPNERISIKDYRTVVRYYAQLIRNADALPE